MKAYNELQSKEREINDLYCTNPIAVQMLLKEEEFNFNVWECCNGLGHISKELEKNGYNVRKSDIINYTNEKDIEIIDILKYNKPFDGDIVTNPPYKYATEMAYKFYELSNKFAIYVNLSFLTSQRRKELFEKIPPKTIYIMSKRIHCAKGGDFEKFNNGAIDYCWIVWDKSYKGETIVKWL